MKIVIGTVCLIATIAQAHAADIKFHILNSTPYDIQVRFYSKTRAVSWPGPSSAWNQTTDHVVHDYSLGCNPGEKVCYGAWSMPHHADKWGLGDNSKATCTSCCGTCGSNITEINLGLGK
jgi:hypothetical protein